MINIKNYTSIVPVDTSVSNIEKLLVSHGAGKIMKEYDGFGNLTAISFQKKFNEQNLSFRLPAEIDSVKKLFLSSKPHGTDKQKKDLEAQAKRTAWKNIHDWVALQMTMILLEQMKFEEVFLSHIIGPGGKTVYQTISEKGFKELGQ